MISLHPGTRYQNLNVVAQLYLQFHETNGDKFDPQLIVKGIKMTNYNAVHLIDIENLCGFGIPSAADISRAREIYEDEVGIQDGDLVLVAAGTQNKAAVRSAWPTATHIFRPGANGADIAIAQFICESETLTNRFGRAFLGSGDGGLAPYVNHLNARGLDTIVVSRPSALSWKMNAFDHIAISESCLAEMATTQFALCA
jgi:hypothetical protein